MEHQVNCQAPCRPFSSCRFFSSSSSSCRCTSSSSSCRWSSSSSSCRCSSSSSSSSCRCSSPPSSSYGKHCLRVRCRCRCPCMVSLSATCILGHIEGTCGHPVNARPTLYLMAIGQYTRLLHDQQVRYILLRLGPVLLQLCCVTRVAVAGCDCVRLLLRWLLSQGPWH